LKVKQQHQQQHQQRTQAKPFDGKSFQLIGTIKAKSIAFFARNFLMLLAKQLGGNWVETEGRWWE